MLKLIPLRQTRIETMPIYRLLMLIIIAPILTGCIAKDFNIQDPQDYQLHRTAHDSEIVIIDVIDVRPEKELLGQFSQAIVGSTDVTVLPPGGNTEANWKSWWGTVVAGELREAGFKAYYQGTLTNSMIETVYSQIVGAGVNPLPPIAEIQLISLSMYEELADKQIDRRRSYTMTVKGRIDFRDPNTGATLYLFPLEGSAKMKPDVASAPLTDSFLQKLLNASIDNMELPTREDLDFYLNSRN